MANLHIEGSSKLTRAEFLEALWKMELTPAWLAVVPFRSNRSLLREWAAHKLLYSMHLWRSHTESVDLNYPQKWYVRLAYAIVGEIGLIFYE